MTRRDGWLRRRAFGMVDRLGSATAGRRVAEWDAAAEVTPHGKPIELTRGPSSGRASST